MTREEVLARIDERELVELALELGNIYSPVGHEGPACEYVHGWLAEHGFAPRKIGAFEDRYNVVGRLQGTGDGYSLIFNSHLDTIMSRDDRLMYLDPDRDVYHKAWADDEGRVWGMPVVNCKGPMACWMVAAKAIKESGVELRGDLLLTHVVGEIDMEPVDEYQGHDYLAEDIGTRYMVSHGALADFALVGEATNFQAGLVEAGKVFFKIVVPAGPATYTPFLPRPTERRASPNAIVRMATFIDRFEEWADGYERRYAWESESATVIPKASIGAIRAGLPYKVFRQPELCSIYVDVRLTPVTSPLAVERELREVALEAGLDAEITPYLYRRGYEAQGVGPLYDALVRAHTAVIGRPLERPDPPTVSMWRDTNPFNELGISALTYGPGPNAATGRGYFTVQEMLQAARVYALTALDLCTAERAP